METNIREKWRGQIERIKRINPNITDGEIQEEMGLSDYAWNAIMGENPEEQKRQQEIGPLEMKILNLYKQGYSRATIAKYLDVSVKSVRSAIKQHGESISVEDSKDPDINLTDVKTGNGQWEIEEVEKGDGEER